MDENRVNQFMMMLSSKIPTEAIPSVRQQLLNSYVDETTMSLLISDMKDSTVALILSILVGYLGVDRFYIGDTGLGIGKLLTGGGCGIWALVDIFLIIGATKQKNLEKLYMYIR